jgi:hypothetical protein
MTTSTIKIQLYQEDGRQWATITLDGPDEPTLALADAVKALGIEISRFHLQGTPGGIPLDLGRVEPVELPATVLPVSMANLLGMPDDSLAAEPVAEVEPEAPPEASPSLRQKQYEQVKHWQEKGGQVSLQGFDLSHQDLSGVDLAGADLSGSNLEGVTLTNANLAGANLSGADLSVSERWRLRSASPV